jgi:hypothetical protein
MPASLALNEPLLQQPVDSSTGIPAIPQIHRTDHSQFLYEAENLTENAELELGPDSLETP